MPLPIDINRLNAACRSQATLLPRGGEYLVFRLSHAEYALELPMVHDLCRQRDLIRFERLPFLGDLAVSTCGRAAPVIDLRRNFEFSMPSYDIFSVIIVMESGRGLVGIAADGLADIVTLAPRQMVPGVGANPFLRPEHIRGHARDGNRFITLLNLPALLAAPEIGLVEALPAHEAG